MRQLKISKQVTNRDAKSLDKYFQEISKIGLITADEEVELALKIKKGDSNMKVKEITKDMMLNEVLALDERLQYVMLGFGLHCFGCPLSQMETIEDAAKGHDIDVEMLLEQLNEMYSSPVETKDGEKK
jgi:hybrid cluster-associated redox disulfide protein